MSAIIEKKTFSWSYLIWGVVFIIASLIVFGYPVENMIAFTLVFGILAVLGGIWFITHRFGSNFRLLFGILEILIGIYLIFYPGEGAIAIAMVLALWFAIDSISNLCALNFYRTLGRNYYWFMLVINVLGVIVGAILFLQPYIAMLALSLLIGFYFMMNGMAYIVLAFTPGLRFDFDGRPQFGG